MKRIKLVEPIKIKNKIIMTVLFSILFSLTLIINISAKISNAIINTADALIKRENTMIFKKSYSEKEKYNVDIDNLINIYKNKKDEIIEVNFNILECEKLMLKLIEEMNANTNMITEEGYILYIPLGYITNNPLLINLGPKIPVKISTTDIVVGEVKTSIREFGINNALIELYIDFDIETNAILPLKSGTTKEKYRVLVSSKIINGTVPSFYNGKNYEKSETFNLPITENM